jgi:hypothetical protein
MMTESDKYKKVMNILREATPVLNSTEDIEREVLKRISHKPQGSELLTSLVNMLFGWAYIGWVRRSFITASALLILVFIYQQGIILRQINYLSRQAVTVDMQNSFIPAVQVEQKLMLFKLAGRKFSSRNITISEEKMDQLLRSVNDLQLKYKDLINLIEEDPDLKKYIENRLNDKSYEKTKL